MAAKPVIIFVRHGDYAQLPKTPSAFQPFPLTPAGQQHAVDGAKELSAILKARGLRLHKTVYSSVLLRAWQTAQIMVDILAPHGDQPSSSTGKLTIEETADLAERSVGALANLSLDQIAAVMQADPRHDALPDGWKSDSHFRLPYPGAESLMQAGQRVAEYILDKVPNLEDGEALLCVGHGASIRHAACVMGAMTLDQVHAHSMYHGRPVLIGRDDQGDWTTIAGAWKQRQKSGTNPVPLLDESSPESGASEEERPD